MSFRRRTRILMIMAVVCLAGIALLRSLLQPGGDIRHYQHYYLHDPAAPQPGEVKITFLGATSFLIEDDETRFMLDGFISRPPLWRVAFTRLATDEHAANVMLQKLNITRLDAMLVSHSHYDHAFDIAYIAKRTGAKLHGSASTLNIARGGGVAEAQLQLYEPEQVIRIGRFHISVRPSLHTPSLAYINDDLGEPITTPLRQPARYRDYKEGGSYDFLIRHDHISIYIKPDTNFIPGALDHIRADVLFLGTATLGKQPAAFQQTFYTETVGKLKPRLLIPIHWDNFFQPLTSELTALPLLGDDLQQSFDFLIGRTQADQIQFHILQGYQSLIIRPSGLPVTDL